MSPSTDAGLRAVIFDCDGTLLDTEALAWAALRQTLAEAGVHVAEPERLLCTGRNQRDVFDALSARYSLPPADLLWPRVTRTLRRMAPARVPVFTDALRMLMELAERDIPVAVASSSSRDRLDWQLRSAGIAHLIASSVAGDEITQGKPAPDIYLAAAASLGIPPERCLAVEDHAVGVLAASRAGCEVLQVVRDAPLEERRNPRVVSSLHHVVARFAWTRPDAGRRSGAASTG